MVVKKTSKRVTKPPDRAPEKHVRCGGKACCMNACKREYKAKGYCRAHYRQWRHGKFSHSRYKICVDSACKKAMVNNCHGFCEQHYQNYYIKGIEQVKVPAPENLAAKPAPAAASA